MREADFLTKDQLPTIRAALRFSSDEMSPNGPDVAAPYYYTPVNNSLRVDEIELLVEHLQPSKIRYVLITPQELVLAVTDQPSTVPGPNRNAALIYGPDVPDAGLNGECPLNDT